MRTTGEMLGDLVKIRHLHVGVPTFLRIEHDVGSFLASAETHIRFDLDIVETLGRDPLLQLNRERLGATRLAIDILADKTDSLHQSLLKFYLPAHESRCNSLIK
jgi:hypothetical protein